MSQLLESFWSQNNSLDDEADVRPKGKLLSLDMILSSAWRVGLPFVILCTIHYFLSGMEKLKKLFVPIVCHLDISFFYLELFSRS